MVPKDEKGWSNQELDKEGVGRLATSSSGGKNLSSQYIRPKRKNYQEGRKKKIA